MRRLRSEVRRSYPNLLYLSRQREDRIYRKGFPIRIIGTGTSPGVSMRSIG